MNNKHIKRALIWSCVAPACFLHAQDEVDDEVFELSPFVVDASEDEGYRATSSLAGSRLKTDLKDIGAAISVVTKDLIDDLGATDLNDVLLYTTATEAAGLGGNFSGASVSTGSRANSDNVVNNPGSAYRIRGLAAPDRTRGYFRSSIPYDSYNSSRIDISRGANSILFGLGSPAGVIDAGIHHANANKDSGEIRFRVASGSSQDDLSYRAEIDYNKVLIDGKLGFRISAVEDDRKFRQDPSFRNSSRYYGSLIAKPWKGATFRLNHETGSIDSNNPDPVSPTENITSYLDGIAEFHNVIETHGIREPIPDSWDPNNLPFYYDSFTRAIKADRNFNINGESFAPLYRLPNQIAAADSGYSNPFHVSGPNIFRNGVVVYENSFDADPAFAFIGQVQNKAAQAGNAAVYAANGGAPEGFRVPGNRIATANTQGVRNIGNRNRNWHVPTVQDLELFDFTRYLLAGTAGKQMKDFDATTASWEQTFFDNNLGFELAFYDETYENFNSNPFRSIKAAITVDVQKTLPVGGENPNFGRTYSIDRVSINNQFEDRKSIRFTAFARYDFEERMFSDNFLGKFLGEHTLTGLYAEDELDSLRYNVNENWISDDPEVQSVLSTVMGTKTFQRQVAYMNYLSPAVDLLSDPASLTIRDFAVTPNAIQNQRIPDTGGTQILQMYSQGELQNYELRRAPYIRGGTLSNVQVDSEAIVLQSRWLNDSIITTYGYREDTRNELRNTPPPLDPNDPNNTGLTVGTGNATIDPQYFNLEINAFGEPIEPNIQIAETSSLSVVARLPRNWRKGFFAENDIALFYSNTSAGAVRLNHLYDEIDQPSGETEEIGINASLFEGKLNLRVNKFESTIVGANARGRLNQAIGDAALKSIQTSLARYTEIGDDFAAIDDDPDSRRFGERLYPNYEKVPEYINTIAGLFGANINLNNNSISVDDSHPLADVWRASLAQLTVGPDGQLQEPGWFHRTPPLLADTQDIVSEGLEAEIVFNPTKNWRMLLNATQTETKTSNSLPNTAALIELWEPVLYGNRQTGDLLTEQQLSFVGGLRRDTPLPVPNLETHPQDSWQLTAHTWNKAVVDPFNVVKALDGQKNPEEREWRINFVTNYTFREGRFKGFSFGGSVRWQDEVAIGYPLINILGETVPDVSSPYFGPSDINYGLRFGYRTKLRNNINWSISLNLNNITSDQDEFIPVGAQPDGSIAVVRTPAPRTFSLTNSFKF